MNRTEILNSQDCFAKLKRIAYQIYEHNYDEKSLVLVGLQTRGYQIAQVLTTYLEEICSLRLMCLPFDRSKPFESLPAATEKLENPIYIVIDDVLYTGVTLFNTVIHLHKLTPRPIQVAVLIDRGNRLLPIHANFVGHQMATTLQEYVMVSLTDLVSEHNHNEESMGDSFGASFEKKLEIRAYLADSWQD